MTDDNTKVDPKDFFPDSKSVAKSAVIEALAKIANPPSTCFMHPFDHIDIVLDRYPELTPQQREWARAECRRLLHQCKEGDEVPDWSMVAEQAKTWTR